MDALKEMMVAPYLAGFFDGEGCITVNQNSIRVQASQVNPAPLRLFHERYGGSMQNNLASRRNDRARDAHVWMLHGRATETLLRELLPYLIVKREEAELALAFLRLPRGKGQLTADIRQTRLDIDASSGS